MQTERRPQKRGSDQLPEARRGCTPLVPAPSLKTRMLPIRNIAAQAVHLFCFQHADSAIRAAIPVVMT